MLCGPETVLTGMSAVGLLQEMLEVDVAVRSLWLPASALSLRLV